MAGILVGASLYFLVALVAKVAMFVFSSECGECLGTKKFFDKDCRRHTRHLCLACDKNGRI